MFEQGGQHLEGFLTELANRGVQVVLEVDENFFSPQLPPQFLACDQGITRKAYTRGVDEIKERALVSGGCSVRKI